ncbi:IclR family transcriptional regulator C-terminal domain-containing protein [Pseudomonas wenzhouensis]|nr:IclR family transcriptional regulator C-terminal domain-containing protein [Pseudomonas wenzhouensis]MDM9653788.1 IclR family transcriptional regulator C-terminal domain-containing protein [Pseudomonas wenzhouensis]
MAWLKLMRGYAHPGWAYDTGKDEPSIRCVAAPIRDGSRKTVAAVSLSGTLEYMDEKRMQALVPVVCETTRDQRGAGSSQG